MNPVVVEILTSVGKTFAVMGIGLAFHRLWRRDIEALTDLAMKLFVPCLAFSVISSQVVTLGDLAIISGSGALVMMGTLAIVALLFRVARIQRRGLFLPVVFMNAANLPFPILEANYGREGLGYGVLFYLAASALLFTVGIAIVARSPDPRGLLKTPVTIATLAALAFKAAGAPVPALLLDTTDLVGRAAIPTILFIYGYSLGEVRLRDIRLALLGALLRLGLGLVLGLAAVRLFGVVGVARDVIILVSAMPSAVVNVVIARQYDADPELVASVVLLTSLAALVTIPTLLVILRT
jgi:predicted permease